MQKYSFTEKKDLLIPNTLMSRPFYDKDGKELSGDELIKVMARIADKWQNDTRRPVPIPEQQFVGWVRQASKLLDEGMSSDEIFRKTLIGGVL